MKFPVSSYAHQVMGADGFDKKRQWKDEENEKIQNWHAGSDGRSGFHDRGMLQGFG